MTPLCLFSIFSPSCCRSNARIPPHHQGDCRRRQSVRANPEKKVSEDRFRTAEVSWTRVVGWRFAGFRQTDVIRAVLGTKRKGWLVSRWFFFHADWWNLGKRPPVSWPSRSSWRWISTESVTHRPSWTDWGRRNTNRYEYLFTSSPPWFDNCRCQGNSDCAVNE